MSRITTPRRSAKQRAITLRRAEDQNKVLEGARAGKTDRAIALELGCSPSRVGELRREALAAVPAPAVEEYRNEVIERTRAIIETHFPTRNRPESAKILLSADRLLTDVLGLAEPTKVDIQGSIITESDGEAILAKLALRFADEAVNPEAYRPKTRVERLAEARSYVPVVPSDIEITVIPDKDNRTL